MEFMHIIGLKKQTEVQSMNKKNFLIGMGMGLTVGGVIAMATRPRKRCMKSAVGKTLKTMGEVADSISDSLGW